MRTIRRLALASSMIAGLVLSPTLAPPASALTAPEGAVRDLTNAARSSVGVPKLWVSTPLSNYARQHSREMAARNTLYHQDLPKLLRGWNWRTLGENLGLGANVTVIHQAWMASSAHRANILNRSFDRMGVGVHIDSAGRRWATVIFYGD
jgi:uncharacterized protein YkwD